MHLHLKKLLKTQNTQNTNFGDSEYKIIKFKGPKGTSCHLELQ